jgi:hypothetical protein
VAGDRALCHFADCCPSTVSYQPSSLLALQRLCYALGSVSVLDFISPAIQLASESVSFGDIVCLDFDVEIIPLDLQFVHLILPSAYVVAPEK